MGTKRSPSFIEALPHLMSEWDYDKNVESPDEIPCKSKVTIDTKSNMYCFSAH